MNTDDTTTLALWIEKRHDYLRQLRDLGRKQLELIEMDAMSHLLTVLGNKGRVLAELQITERALDPFRHQDPASRQWSSHAERERCARLVNAGDSLLAEIVTLEQQAESTMTERRQQTLYRLQHLHAAGAASGAYAAANQPIHHRLDLSSET